MSPTRVYLIRHGETVYNSQSKVQGQGDIPLSPRGEEQAQVLAARLDNSNYPIDLFISSDLSRAWRTAEILNQQRQLAIIENRNWREAHFGTWEGQGWPELYDPNSPAWQEYVANWYHYKDHQGESWHDVTIRVEQALAEILSRYQGKNVAVITHGGTVRIAIMVALKMPKEFFPLIIGNTSLTEFVFSKNRWTMVRMNDMAHLEF